MSTTNSTGPGEGLSLVDEIATFDVEDLELGEIVVLEDAFGLAIDEINFTSAKAMMYLLFLFRRREDPGYTLEEAGRVKLRALDEDPTPAAPKASKGKSKRAANGSRS